MKAYQYIWAPIILLLITACGSGDGSGGSTANVNTQLFNIDSAVKAENTLYEIEKSSKDFFALTGWSEMILEAINNALVEPEQPVGRSPYKDLVLSCPVKGTMTVNGSIVSNGSMGYDIEVLMKDCYLDRNIGLEGLIAYKGTAFEDTALEMEAIMKEFHIGLYLLSETIVNTTIKTKNDSGGNYKTVLNGSVVGKKEAIEFENFTITVDKNVEKEPQAMDGIFNIVKSATPCIVGKYRVSTITPLTDSGKIRVNSAVITYNKDKSNKIEFDKESIVVGGSAKLTCR